MVNIPTLPEELDVTVCTSHIAGAAGILLNVVTIWKSGTACVPVFAVAVVQIVKLFVVSWIRAVYDPAGFVVYNMKIAADGVASILVPLYKNTLALEYEVLENSSPLPFGWV